MLSSSSKRCLNEAFIKSSPSNKLKSILLSKKVGISNNNNNKLPKTITTSTPHEEQHDGSGAGGAGGISPWIDDSVPVVVAPSPPPPGFEYDEEETQNDINVFQDEPSLLSPHVATPTNNKNRPPLKDIVIPEQHSPPNLKPTTPTIEFKATAQSSTKLGTIPKLLVRDLQKQDGNEVRWAIEDLTKLVKLGGQPKQDALRLGAPTLIVIVMTKWLAVAGGPAPHNNNNNYELAMSIQQKACDCLKYLLSRTTHTIQWTIHQTGAMDVILDVMELYPDSLSLQRSATGALKELITIQHLLEGGGASSSSYHQHSSSSATDFVKELGGHEVVVQAMIAFPDDITLQKICCSLFLDLSQVDDFHYDLLISGAGKACHDAATKHHADNGEIRRLVRQMLRNMKKQG